MRYRTYWIQNFTCSVNRGEETAVNVANGSVRLALQKELIRKKILAVCMTHNNAGAGKLDGDANVTLATVFGMAFLLSTNALSRKTNLEITCMLELTAGCSLLTN